VWPVLAALVVAILAAVAVVAVTAADDESAEAFLTATEPAIAAPLTAADTAGAETAPAAGLRATLPELSETEPVPTSPPPPRRGQLTKWPAGTDGFTVVLASVPEGGQAAATAKAKEAADAGLAEVGVLSSSQYSSLHPGYLVVFSGVHATRDEAEAAIENARAKGYNDAYAAQVAR
jgi:hypothetical protein